MKQFHVLMILLMISHSTFAQLPEMEMYNIHPSTSAIKIDGVLDESDWEVARPIPVNMETDPGNNLPAEWKTTLRMIYDADNLYFSFQVEDAHPEKIRAIINDRDRLDDNDFVTLFLDPFEDSRRAFFFSVNPLGVQEDGFYDEQVGDDDLTWDAIWESAGRITGDGYIVEASVPFKSLRFPSRTGVQTWRFFGRRVLPRSIERTYHSMPIDQNNTCLLCQSNRITGLEGIKPGRNLEFTPTLTIIRFDENKTFPEGGVDKGDPDLNIGLDARWGITSDLSLNATINPDFSNVEADAAQLNVNNRFALRFPEKRPFFQEGADFFNTPIQAFFSRSLADPTFGIKITGKVKKNALGVLVAEDQINNLLLPGFQGSSATSVNQRVRNVIGRFRRDIGENSNVGVLYTGRYADGYHNQTGGLDAYIRPWDPLSIRLQFLRSETRYDSLALTDQDVPTETIRGDGFHLNILYDTRNWNSRLVHEYFNPDFRTDAGFVPQVDFVRTRFWIERVFWPDNNQFVANFGMNTGAFKRRSTEGVLDFGGGWISAFINGPLQLNYWINPDLVWQQFEGQRYRLFRFWSGFDIQPHGNLGINGWINLGPAVDFENNRKADNVQFKLESDIRLGRHVDMSINHRLLKLDHQGQRIFTANLSQVQAAYNFTVRLFLKMIVQFRHTVRNPDLYEDPDVNRVDESVFAQVLLSYKLNPQSVLFLGYVDNHAGFENEIDFREIPLTRVNQTLFFKMGYAWRP